MQSDDVIPGRLVRLVLVAKRRRYEPGFRLRKRPRRHGPRRQTLRQFRGEAMRVWSEAVAA